MWRADTADQALECAAADSELYCEDISGVDTGLYQSYETYPVQDEDFSPVPTRIPQGMEVFSLMRGSDLDLESYIGQFFATGAEHEQTND